MQLAKEAATAIELIVGILEGQRANLTGTCVDTIVELSPDDDARADACTHRQTHHIAGALSFAIAPGTEGKTVGIVVYGYGHTELFLQDVLQVYFLPRGDIGNVVDNALPVVDN